MKRFLLLSLVLLVLLFVSCSAFKEKLYAIEDDIVIQGTLHCDTTEKAVYSTVFSPRSLVEGDNTVYDKNLAMLLCMASADVYSGFSIELEEPPAVGKNTEDWMLLYKKMGMKDIQWFKLQVPEGSPDPDDRGQG
ncbi:MAG: hypothetical protein KBS81_08335, partial [Spirochaetales bacterium]|nr:hypothetical protein [Candidatus Physcosoma equi]